jgi:hypothetical protein
MYPAVHPEPQDDELPEDPDDEPLLQLQPYRYPDEHPEPQELSLLQVQPYRYPGVHPEPQVDPDDDDEPPEDELSPSHQIRHQRRDARLLLSPSSEDTIDTSEMPMASTRARVTVTLWPFAMTTRQKKCPRNQKAPVYLLVRLTSKLIVRQNQFVKMIEDYKYDSDLGEISLRRICSESMTFDIVDLIACERSTFGNDCILSSFFSFILTSNKFF